MSKELIPQKEVAEYNNQISLVVEKAEGLTIVSEEDMVVASDVLDEVKKVEKSIVDRKKEITGPLMTALASARSLFKPLESGHKEAKGIIKEKMLDYTVAEEERIEVEKERVVKRVEKGTMRVDTGIKKMEDIGDTPKSFEGTNSKTSIKKITKLRIIDESLIPREYLIPDLKKLTEAVLKNKIEVAGTETFIEKSIVGRSNR